MSSSSARPLASGAAAGLADALASASSLWSLADRLGSASLASAASGSRGDARWLLADCLCADGKKALSVHGANCGAPSSFTGTSCCSATRQSSLLTSSSMPREDTSGWYLQRDGEHFVVLAHVGDRLVRRQHLTVLLSMPTARHANQRETHKQHESDRERGHGRLWRRRQAGRSRGARARPRGSDNGRGEPPARTAGRPRAPTSGRTGGHRRTAPRAAARAP